MKTSWVNRPEVLEKLNWLLSGWRGGWAGEFNQLNVYCVLQCNVARTTEDEMKSETDLNTVVKTT